MMRTRFPLERGGGGGAGGGEPVWGKKGVRRRRSSGRFHYPRLSNSSRKGGL